MKLSDDESKGLHMDCQKVENQNIIERYLTEGLSEREAEAFEQHYLECPRCFGELQMRHAAAIELTGQPILLTPVRSRWMRLSWEWSLSLASVVVVLAVLAGVLYLRSREEGPPSQIATVQPPTAATLEQLAAVDQIPPYIPGLIRGGETNPALIKFQEGMNLFSSQKYADAIAPLSEAARLDPQHVPTAFYLGISYLVSGNTESAIEQLSKVISHAEYAEEAHWFLAKAYLKERNFRLARTELNTVEALHGAYATSAKDLLNRIQSF